MLDVVIRDAAGVLCCLTLGSYSSSSFNHFLKKKEKKKLFYSRNKHLQGNIKVK